MRRVESVRLAAPILRRNCQSRAYPNIAAQGNIHVLEAPTTGLHIDDADTLIGLFNRLVDAGSTMIVIKHIWTRYRGPIG